MDEQDVTDRDDRPKMYQKKVNALNEIVKGVGKFGADSAEFGKIFDGMLHFLSVPPTADDFHIPSWISLARWKSKSAELAGSDFWFHISQGADKYCVSTDVAQPLQEALVQNCVASPTRHIEDGMVASLQAFSVIPSALQIHKVLRVWGARVAILSARSPEHLVKFATPAPCHPPLCRNPQPTSRPSFLDGEGLGKGRWVDGRRGI